MEWINPRAGSLLHWTRPSIPAKLNYPNHSGLEQLHLVQPLLFELQLPAESPQGVLKAEITEHDSDNDNEGCHMPTHFVEVIQWLAVAKGHKMLHMNTFQW